MHGCGKNTRGSMGRIRSLKPEFGHHDKLSALPAEVHLFAALLLPYADDYGYFPANPKLVHAACCPLRELLMSVPEILGKLRDIGYIELMTGEDGREYGKVTNFLTHQRVAHPTPSRIQPIISSTDKFVNPHDTFSPDLGGEVEREVEGEAEPALHPLHFAHKMIQVLSIPNTQANMRAIEAALSAECQFTGSSLEECAQAISDHAMRARAQGSAIDKFYFEDTKWRSNGSRKQTSAAVERVNRNRGNLIEALRSHVGERTGSDGGKR